MEEEREKMRQEIRDKVRNRAIPLIARVNYPTNPQLSLRNITCVVVEDKGGLTHTHTHTHDNS